MNESPPLRLSFDAARCDGWGMCTVVFPDGISLDPWGFAHVTDEPVTDARLQHQARRAAACCPRHALSVSYERRAPTPTTMAGGQESQ